MTSVTVKTVDQQADSMILKHRERLLTQRTAAINALRGFAAEFGVIAAKGAVQFSLTGQAGLRGGGSSGAGDDYSDGRTYRRAGSADRRPR